MSTDETPGRGITDADRERIAAFNAHDGGPGRASTLEGDGETGASTPSYSDATESLAAYLCDRLDPGMRLVTYAGRIGREVGRSAHSVARSLETLRDGNPDGLVVEYERRGDGGQWVIERTGGDER